MRLYYYQPYVNMHYSSILRALAEKHKVTFYVDRDMDPKRKMMGLIRPSMGEVNIQVAPSYNELEKNVKHAFPDDIHIGSLSHSCKVAATIRKLRKKYQFNFGISSEYLRGKFGRKEVKFGRNRMLALPYLIYTLVQIRYYRSVIDFVLAMGDLGVKYFCRLGFDEKIVFPYCYTVESCGCTRPFIHLDKNNYQIIFIGSLYPWKSLDAVLKALSAFRSLNWTLHIVGEGPDRAKLESMAWDLKIDQKIKWYGFLPNDAVRTLLKRVDLLVLPSWYEGWGAVVNEALMSGTPVVASDHCGASVVLDNNIRGEVFKEGDINDLRRVLTQRIKAGHTDQKRRDMLALWSKCIDGSSVAEYTEQVMKSVYYGNPRPAPPWSGVNNRDRTFEKSY